MRASRLGVFWLILLGLGTLHPFVESWRAVVVPSETFFVPRFKGFDPPLNVILFLPLGMVVRRLGGRVWHAFFGGLALSACVELAQHYVAFRVPVFEDLVFNSTGAALGAWFGPRLERLVSIFDRPWPRVALFGGVFGFIAWSAAPPAVEPRLWRWECGAELVAGREVPGNYRFDGVVNGAAVYAGSVAPHELGPPTSVQEGRADALCAQIQAAGAFTVDVVLTSSASSVVDEPQRIYTFSGGVQRRNFMLASRGDRLVFRVRTRVTPVVGIFPDGEEPLELPMPAPGRATRITINYDGEVLTAFVDGAMQSQLRFQLPLHSGVRFFWLPRSSLGVWLYAFSASLVLGALVSGPLAFAPAVLTAFLLALSTELVQLTMFERSVDLASALPMLVGAAIGAWSTRR